MNAELTTVLDAVIASLGGERREGQQQMAIKVAKALTDETRLLVEAGTGTGKSMAYLVPALMHAVNSGKRTVVSTATLALQRQILGTDAPMVADQVEKETSKRPQVALLKGWHNYVCKHKVAGGYPNDADALFGVEGLTSADTAEDHDAGPTSQLGEQIQRVREFAEDSLTGDRDDLNVGVGDRAWRHVSVTKLECLGQRCPLLAECFPELARQSAIEADIVVTNHAMLGVVASGNTGVLPEHDVLIVDEAHELPARVTNQATEEISAASIERVGRVVRRNAGLPTSSLDEAAVFLREALTVAPPGRWSQGLPLEVNAAVRDIAEATRALLVSLRQEHSKEANSGAHLARSELVLLQEVADRLLTEEVSQGDEVVWLEPPRRPGEPSRICVAPLDVAGKIHAHLFSERAVIATSATLALGGSFDPIAKSLGFFDNYEATTVESPFEYPRQGILYIAAHLPPPGRDGLGEQTVDEIAELIEAAGGGALGLFSSRRGAEEAAMALRERLSVPILLQGEDGLPALVRQFSREPDTCLFGTLSLWQGIDVPGSSCRLVFIDRIPFPRPDDPIMSARSDEVDRRGGSGFMAVSASHAALLLAQGAGRLIRGIDDRGVVALLDSRVASKRYGTFLKRSLPPFWPTSSPEVVREALSRLTSAQVPNL